jgi:hypothetical protein
MSLQEEYERNKSIIYNLYICNNILTQTCGYNSVHIQSTKYYLGV